MFTSRKAASIVLICTSVVAGCKKHDSATTQTTAQTSQAAASPVPKRIMSKDPDCVAVLTEPTGDDLLKWSPSYKTAVEQIDARASAIADSDLREQQRTQLRRDLVASNLARYEKEAKQAFLAERQQVLERHRNDWFEIGHIGTLVGYSDGRLAVLPEKDSPIGMRHDDYLYFAVDIPTMDSAYSKFDAVAKADIDAKYAFYRDRIDQMRREGQVVPDDPYSAVYKEAQDEVRSDRLVVVAQGDLVQHRVDKVMLVDYETETVVGNIDEGINPAEILWWKLDPPARADVTNHKSRGE